MTKLPNSSILGHYLNQLPQRGANSTGYLYRGQAHESWPLHSAAIRRILRSREDIAPEALLSLYSSYHRSMILPEARNRYTSHQSVSDLTDLELLAVLQHFGAATGLLDFTRSPLVALWFATDPDPRTKDVNGQVYTVDPTISFDESTFHTDFVRQPLDSILSQLREQNKMLAWSPPALREAGLRITAQQSVFVLYPPMTRQHPSVPAECLVDPALEVAAEDKEELRRALVAAGIRDASLFPDFFGYVERNGVSAPLHFPQAEMLQIAQSYHRNADFAKAVSTYSDLLTEHPNAIVARYLRAMARAELGEHFSAVEDYDVAQNSGHLHPGISPAALSFNRGNSKAALKDYDGAIADYGRALELDPTLSGVRFNRGNSYFAIGKFEAALQDFHEVEDNRHASFNAGNVLIALGRFSEAMDIYERAVQQESNNHGALQNRAIAVEVNQLIADRQFEVSPPNHSDEIRLLRIEVKVPSVTQEESLRVFSLVGNAGNIGNAGWTAMPGGSGYEGAFGTVIVLQFEASGDLPDA